MKNGLLSALVVLVSSTLFAQETLDPVLFKEQVATLYQNASKSFAANKEGAAQDVPDGTKRFASNLSLSGAREAYITADEENSHTYVAHYEIQVKTWPEAEKKLEELVTLILEATADKGLIRSKGTDINYYKYQKHTVEFPSENIDIMGRYPSFSVGIIKDSNPVTIEVMVNEPLWK